MTAVLQAQWRDQGTPPVVVTLCCGLNGLLTPKGRPDDSGLLEDLLGRLSEIQAKTGAPRRRLLAGELMSALDALILGLSRPRKLRMAALCLSAKIDLPFIILSAIQARLAARDSSKDRARRGAELTL